MTIRKLRAGVCWVLNGILAVVKFIVYVGLFIVVVWRSAGDRY